MSSMKKSESARKFRFLPLTLSLEISNGIASPLAMRGTPLPAKRSQIFTTASDNQEIVAVDIFMGESQIARKNMHITRALFSGISAKPKGEPRIKVTFEVDQACRVTVYAVVEGSDEKLSAEINESLPELSDKKIIELLNKAESEREEDQEILKYAETMNKAEDLIIKAESHLRKRQEKGLRDRNDEEIEQTLAALGLALEQNDPEHIFTYVENLEGLLVSPNLFDLFSGRIFPKTRSSYHSDDLISNLFDAQDKKTEQQREEKTGSTEISISKQKLKDQIVTIFGGGDFTLDPNLCFVLMPFADPMRPIYEDHIKTTVESINFTCLRADEIVGTNLITRDVWENINRARFIIADLSGQNPNVFYEVGLAHALGKEVILLTQTLDDVPFDLKTLRCIIYDYTPRGIKELEKKLSSTIKAIMRSS